MKIIFGIDALEYDFIVDWNLENLMQLQYGTLEVPISEDKRMGLYSTSMGYVPYGEIRS